MTPNDGENAGSETVQRVARALAAEWLPGVEPEFVRAFSNRVYVLRSGPQRLFLRVTPCDRRSLPELISELALVRHLGGCGVPVSEPLPSRCGELVHSVSVGGEEFHGTVFREAPGLEFKDLRPDAGPRALHLAGRTMGRLHREARRFVPPAGFRRWHWFEDRWARFAEFVPEAEGEAWQLYRDLNAWLQELPRDSSLFGWIHGDFTILNMRFADGRITLFDFDSCGEHWYAYEIATFLHYFGAREPAARREAYDEVLGGYAEAAPVDGRTLAAIPLFGKMRLLYSFLVFAEAWGFERLSPEQSEYFALRRRLFTLPPTWPAG
jgi:Ser/Thr protein kinase RdoA (MazF antagonist)